MKKDLLGAWELFSFEAIPSQGETQYPFGKNVGGLIVYTNERMSGQLLNKDRPRFDNDDMTRGNAAEYERAFRGFISYYGGYEIDEEKRILYHRVDGSSFPNWLGTTQIRYYTIENDVLTLTAPPMRLGDIDLTVVLRWRRVASQAA